MLNGKDRHFAKIECVHRKAEYRRGCLGGETAGWRQGRSTPDALVENGADVPDANLVVAAVAHKVVVRKIEVLFECFTLSGGYGYSRVIWCG